MSLTTTYVDEVAAAIAAGQSVSGDIVTAGRTPLWLDTPAGLTGAVVTFVAVDATGAARVLRDAGGLEISLALGAAGGRHSLMPEISGRLAGHATIRIRAGTVGAPSVQAAERSMTLGMRNVI
jgi:hypothetical protein